MSPRLAVFGVLGLALVGSVLIWAFFGAPPEPKTPTATSDQRTVRLSAEDARKIGRAPLAIMRHDKQARDVRVALSRKQRDVDECVELLSMHGDAKDVDEVVLTVSYTAREDGRYDVAVVAQEITDVTFDRCINAVLEGVSVTDDTLGSVEIAVASGE